MADAGIDAIVSLAGRVARPRPLPLPVRVGGFGGVEGLASYLHDHSITHLVDATHPFAAQMSTNAALAAAKVGVPLVVLTRPPWSPVQGDRWQRVADMEGALGALRGTPRRVMLAIGRMHIGKFAALPQHFYLLRLVDPPEVPIPLPDHHAVISRGPFTLEGDLDLLRTHRIDVVVSKNSGGSAARAKLDAARQLGINVVMIDRPPLPVRAEVDSVDQVMAWLGHSATERGV